MQQVDAGVDRKQFGHLCRPTKNPQERGDLETDGGDM